MGRLIDADEAIKKQWYGNSNPILYRQYAVQVLKNCPTVDAVLLTEIYRVIAGHSDYHGDDVLAALTCIAEGKEVKPVRPLPTVDAVPVKLGKWILHKNGDATCNQCGKYQKAIWDYDNWQNFCGNCGADMREVQNERD